MSQASKPAALTATPLAARLPQVATPTGSWLSGKPAPSVAPRPLFGAPAAEASTAGGGAPAPDAAAIEAQKREIAEARAAAEKEGLTAAQTKVEEIVERYLDGIQNLLAATRLAHRPEPGEVVELALVIAKEILGRELTVDRSHLLAVVDKSLESVSADTQLVLRVSPGDATYVKQRRPELLREGVVITEDRTLTVGGCVVETPAWVLDASIEARLDAVRAGLVDLLASAPTDETRDEEPRDAPADDGEENR